MIDGQGIVAAHEVEDNQHNGFKGEKSRLT
jgi:hypothetical protein